MKTKRLINHALPTLSDSAENIDRPLRLFANIIYNRCQPTSHSELRLCDYSPKAKW